MKKLLFITFLLVSLGLRAQVLSDSLISRFSPMGYYELGRFEVDEKGEKIMTISFRNEDYTYITDMAYIFFRDSSHVNQFITDIKAVMAKMQTNGLNYSVKRSDYTISSVGNYVVISDLENKNALLRVGTTNKLIAWMQSVKW